MFDWWYRTNYDFNEFMDDNRGYIDDDYDDMDENDLEEDMIIPFVLQEVDNMVVIGKNTMDL